MAKKQNDLKAKQKRQKVLAAGGAVLLIGLLAFQVPRTMKMLNAQAPPPPPAAAPTAVPTDPSVLPTPGTVGGEAAPSASAGGTLVDSDTAPAAATGQLVAFGRFSSKDPFHQQIDPRAAGSGGGEAGEAVAPAPAEPAVTTPPSGGAAVGSSPVTPTAPSASAAPAVAALIAVNGVEETVTKGADFPKASPVFTLVSIAKNEVRIAIAGGALASGARAVPLAKGKTLTLVNTADGTRYELKLVAVGG